jgi:hypothetical protein
MCKEAGLGILPQKPIAAYINKKVEILKMSKKLPEACKLAVKEKDISFVKLANNLGKFSLAKTAKIGAPKVAATLSENVIVKNYEDLLELASKVQDLQQKMLEDQKKTEKIKNKVQGLGITIKEEPLNEV